MSRHRSKHEDDTRQPRDHRRKSHEISKSMRSSPRTGRVISTDTHQERRERERGEERRGRKGGERAQRIGICPPCWGRRRLLPLLASLLFLLPPLRGTDELAKRRPHRRRAVGWMLENEEEGGRRQQVGKSMQPGRASRRRRGRRLDGACLLCLRGPKDVRVRRGCLKRDSTIVSCRNQEISLSVWFGNTKAV